MWLWKITNIQKTNPVKLDRVFLFYLIFIIMARAKKITKYKSNKVNWKKRMKQIKLNDLVLKKISEDGNKTN